MEIDSLPTSSPSQKGNGNAVLGATTSTASTSSVRMMPAVIDASSEESTTIAAAAAHAATAAAVVSSQDAELESKMNEAAMPLVEAQVRRDTQNDVPSVTMTASASETKTEEEVKSVESNTSPPDKPRQNHCAEKESSGTTDNVASSNAVASMAVDDPASAPPPAATAAAATNGATGAIPVARNNVTLMDVDAPPPHNKAQADSERDGAPPAQQLTHNKGDGHARHHEDHLALAPPPASINNSSSEQESQRLKDSEVQDGHEQPEDVNISDEDSGNSGTGSTRVAEATSAVIRPSIPTAANAESEQIDKGVLQAIAPMETPIIKETLQKETPGDEVEDATSSAVTPPTSGAAEVIDLLDDSSDEQDSDASDDTNELVQNASRPPAAKRQRIEGPVKQPPALYPSPAPHATNLAMHKRQLAQQQQAKLLAPYREHVYLAQVPGFTPTWKHMMPAIQRAEPNKLKIYQLSLLNVSEFTITGLRVGDEFNGYVTSIVGLRSQIKQCSKAHGNAYFERDPEGGDGKWHIPLGAYHAFYGLLKSDPMCRVEGISEAQLKIASLGKARLEKDYPSARKLVKFGVPKQLAYALAPFQRGGVDFVIEKEGRALIADEMGLGKTIQGIASMAVYHEEWPLLVLCPSSARFHWENEFRNWLGTKSSINNSEHSESFEADKKENESEGETDAEEAPARPTMPLLHDRQIHVLTSGQNAILPHPSTKVVICSYGLAPNLVNGGKLVPGMFKCAIVDESHMLKSKSTQRTSRLLPILRATNRCVLLSGTPAFARPMELWPQLLILGTERRGWLQEEDEYVRKYARGGTRRRAELHTMLLGTVMIRRMKNDILKTLPVKVREQGVVDVMDVSTRREMQECMVTLRTGKGKLCELARGHTSVEQNAEEQTADANGSNPNQKGASDNPNSARAPSGAAEAAQLAAAISQLRQSIHQRRAEGQANIRRTLATTQHQMDPMMAQTFVQQMENRLESELHATYQEQVHRISQEIASGRAPKAEANSQNEPPSAKKAVLNHMYSLTGKSKVPFIAEMLKQFLKDPTKGKLCIFAHHIYVLDEIAQLAGLSNDTNSTSKYIRIDGSTTPRARQDQINVFQRDPSVRIAILGITAAGVAVTLTASSTVWFAELFWTPAIMIQAEDRCHRIGQQAQVRCLYFVAKGTLDELLWKLLENKFEALGEFVEGKEKMKMVVNKTYHSTHELLKTVAVEDLEDSGEEDVFSDANGECNLTNIGEIDSDIEHEIEALGLSEQVLLDTDADNDGSDPDSQIESDAKPAAKGALGRTEDDAICLSDDDDDVEVVASVATLARSEGSAAATQAETVKQKPSFDTDRAYPQLRHYKLLFGGMRYGIQFVMIAGRMVVTGNDECRERELGPNVKPHVGDVLVAVNRQLVPLFPEMTPILKILADAKAKGPTELVFAEDSEIAAHVTARATPAEKEREKSQAVASVTSNAQRQSMQPPPADFRPPPMSKQRAAQKSDEVIEID